MANLPAPRRHPSQLDCQAPTRNGTIQHCLSDAHHSIVEGYEMRNGRIIRVDGNDDVEEEEVHLHPTPVKRLRILLPRVSGLGFVGSQAEPPSNFHTMLVRPVLIRVRFCPQHTPLPKVLMPSLLLE